MNNSNIRIRLGCCEKQDETRTEQPIDGGTRYEVDNVEGRLGTFDTATVINISLGGLAIETHKYLQVGRSYPLRFKRPNGMLRLSATVAWSRFVGTAPVEKEEVRPVYRAGFKFSNLSVSQKAELEEFVREEVARTAAGRAVPEAERVSDFPRPAVQQGISSEDSWLRTGK